MRILFSGKNVWTNLYVELEHTYSNLKNVLRGGGGQ